MKSFYCVLLSSLMPLCTLAEDAAPAAAPEVRPPAVATAPETAPTPDAKVVPAVPAAPVSQPAEVQMPAAVAAPDAVPPPDTKDAKPATDAPAPTLPVMPEPGASAAATNSAEANGVDFGNHSLFSSEGVLKIGILGSGPMLKLYKSEPTYFYEPLLESRIAVATPRLLLSSEPGSFWSAELWGEGYNASFGIRPNSDNKQAVLLQSIWDGRDFDKKAIQIRATDKAGQERSWVFHTDGNLDAGKNGITNLASITFADGSVQTSAGGLTTNQEVGVGTGKVVLHIEQGRIVEITTP